MPRFVWASAQFSGVTAIACRYSVSLSHQYPAWRMLPGAQREQDGCQPHSPCRPRRPTTRPRPKPAPGKCRSAANRYNVGHRLISDRDQSANGHQHSRVPQPAYQGVTPATPIPQQHGRRNPRHARPQTIMAVTSSSRSRGYIAASLPGQSIFPSTERRPRPRFAGGSSASTTSTTAPAERWTRYVTTHDTAESTMSGSFSATSWRKGKPWRQRWEKRGG